MNEPGKCLPLPKNVGVRYYRVRLCISRHNPITSFDNGFRLRAR
jgi:hypothetical protein